MKPRVLVAGIGNIFFGDDAFGPAVLARLAREPVDGARCEDYGIRGLHLAHELLDGYAAAIVVDAVSRGAAPGTLLVIEPGGVGEPAEPDAHRMDLSSVLGFVHQLGGTPPPITIVGCEPESLEPGADLSATVTAAIDPAIGIIRRIVGERLTPAEERLCTEV